MKKGTAILLQSMVVLIGIGALVFLLWEPHVEGRNAHATLFEIYFKDPFLAFVYVGSVSFFVGLYQAFKAVSHAERGDSQAAVRSLRIIKKCALCLIGFVAVGEVFIFLSESDDRAGGVFMGLLVTVGSIAVATAAARFERVLRNAV